MERTGPFPDDEGPAAAGPSPVPRGPGSGEATPAPSVAAVTEALRAVVDPELGDNIVDLGMVTGVAVDTDGSVRWTWPSPSPAARSGVSWSETSGTGWPGCPVPGRWMSGSGRWTRPDGRRS